MADGSPQPLQWRTTEYRWNVIVFSTIFIVVHVVHGLFVELSVHAFLLRPRPLRVRRTTSSMELLNRCHITIVTRSTNHCDIGAADHCFLNRKTIPTSLKFFFTAFFFRCRSWPWGCLSGWVRNLFWKPVFGRDVLLAVYSYSNHFDDNASQNIGTPTYPWLVSIFHWYY